MSVDGQQIMGSAEPLTPEQTKARLRELKEWGVDLSLVWANLELTPTQRIEAARSLLAFAEEMRRAWKKRQLRYGVYMDTLDLPGLIASKRTTGRPKDLMALPHIEAVLRVRTLEQEPSRDTKATDDRADSPGSSVQEGNGANEERL